MTIPETDATDAFAHIIHAYTLAQGDILAAAGPTAIRATNAFEVYEIEFVGPNARAVLTAEVTRWPNGLEVTPVDFVVRDIALSNVVFSHDDEGPEAFLVRMMAAWLENLVLTHRTAIVARLRAEHPRQVTWLHSRYLH